MYEIIKEGRAKLKVFTGKISKELPVFYNPVMRFNRDVSVLLLNSIDKRDMQIGLPLAGSGVRGIRFLLELGKGKIENVYFNDISKKAVEMIKENLKLNKIRGRLEIHNEDANIFLLQSKGFDYIDIDPFGTPNKYLDNAIKRLARDGILAVTATDTACLCGTFPKTCRRKYWAMPLRNEIMHETGLRILIRKVQMVGGQYDKALKPVFSYSKDHYFRVFFKCEKSKEAVDKVIQKHGMLGEAGPMWLGELWDSKLASKIAEADSTNRFLSVIKEESRIKTAGFYDTHRIVKKYKINHIPKKYVLIKAIRKEGYKASETHFKAEGIRSDIGLKSLLKIIRKTNQ
jgi:tRNA (guanine26-N2/guanine27-N2)-dimethyltransferase